VSKRLHFCVSCDTDPDVNPSFPTPPLDDLNGIWQGIAHGIPALRQQLQDSPFTSDHGHLPITWLLRADRQILELYRDPSFCFKRFERVWESELRLGGEIGWHPHLYGWNERARQWTEYLGQGDDLEILGICLESLRRCSEIRAARTGWAYQTNGLLQFMAHEQLLVDASAIPGTVLSGRWFFEWRGAPRQPYLPSTQDYRKPAATLQDSVGIVEMPSLVRQLNPVMQGSRYMLRRLRGMRSRAHELTDWQSSAFQGVLLTGRSTPFAQALAKTVNASPEAPFISTYFHTDDLLSPTLRQRLVRNVEQVSGLAAREGYSLVPTTLTRAACCARRHLLNPQ
jgi:hypothetical protein